jgi:hypothetical protein
MRNFSRVSVVVVAAAAILTGCVNADPIVTPAPIPSATPLFATEADALAAATAAYAAYLKVSDQILMDGGANPNRIASVATKDARQAALDGYRTFRDKQYKSIGTSQFDRAELQHYSPASTDGRDIIGLYVCLDLTKLDVVDAAGKSVVATDRPDRQALELSFDSSPDTPVGIKLSARSPWPTNDGCLP